MGRLDEIIVKLSELFEAYANDEAAKKKSLDKDELQAMLKNEVDIEKFDGIITMETIEEIFDKMDKNGDDELQLNEFCRTMCKLAVIYYRKKNKGAKK
ncbi:protein S100-G-like [Nerophis ophidion]|uniref:protein S100-G-like n=1 Tax=Nerophis ophidion TaxID=159077 RepID=UPI002AE019EB|nr:protein S100-G-like [Nerophis ophidion]XP_061737948.1 protein S100-G-like [Nerophis ophidion]XP_061737949.1 protein S100-G-like [Nerophis ophidion]XP_061737950.1 protein S100-G-like [Nerophis ophidion]